MTSRHEKQLKNLLCPIQIDAASQLYQLAKQFLILETYLLVPRLLRIKDSQRKAFQRLYERARVLK